MSKVWTITISNVFEINFLCSSSLHLFDQKKSDIQQRCVKKIQSDRNDFYCSLTFFLHLLHLFFYNKKIPPKSIKGYKLNIKHCF